MKRSLTYFIASALFALATGLNLYNEGLNLKTGIGIVLFGILLYLGLNSRGAGD